MSRFFAASIAVLMIALGVRVAAAYWWESKVPVGERFLFPDSESYWTLAGAMAADQPYQYGDAKIFRTPGYPWLLSWLFHGTQEPRVLTARWLGAVMGGATTAVTMCFAALAFDRATSLVAGIMVALYPGAVATSVFVLSEAPFMLLMMLQLLLWWMAFTSDRLLRRLWLSALAGGCAAAAVLTRPSWLLFVPFALAVVAVLFLHRGKQLVITAVTLATMVLCLLPWWARNYALTGHFVPTTLQVGASLYDGWNPQATGASDMSHGDALLEREQSHATAGQEMTEFERDRLLRDAALQWAGQHPGRALQLGLTKFVRMWNIFPNADEFQSTTIRLLLLLTYVPLMALAAVGAWRQRARWQTWICLLPAVYFTLLHIVFVSSIRYREPAMLGMIVLAASVVSAIVPYGRKPKVSLVP